MFFWDTVYIHRVSKNLKRYSSKLLYCIVLYCILITHVTCDVSRNLAEILKRNEMKITPILTLYRANAATLTPFSKEDKILIKNLYECKGYNARQFITEFPDKSTKNRIVKLRKFGTVDMLTGSVTRNFRHFR